MSNNGKLKLTDYFDYGHTNVPEWEFVKIKKAIAKRQRRWDREHSKKEKPDA